MPGYLVPTNTVDQSTTIGGYNVFEAVNSGAILQVQNYTNSTRTSFAGTTGYINLWSGISFTKQNSSSKLLITGNLQIKGGWQYAANMRITIDSTNYDGYIGFMDTANSGTNETAFMKVHPINAEITGLSSGTKTVSFSKGNVDGQGQPAIIFNPNSTDDGRFAQTRSTVTIWEIAV
jgi:hypothetical protein